VRKGVGISHRELKVLWPGKNTSPASKLNLT